MPLSDIDPQIAEVIRKEEIRQSNNLNLIASENYVSKAVLEAQGSVLTNKYAEGYPGRRYYGGCANADDAEQLAIDRAISLFGADHANVQPNSGSTANMAAYMTLINPGDTIMGMDLAHGGHLTHGSPVSFSGKLYKVIRYGLNKETGLLDYDEVEKLAIQNKPQLIIVGSSSYPRILDYANFRRIADKVGAKLVVDMAHVAGLIAAKVYPSPVAYADIVTSTTHKTLRGPRGGLILCKSQYAAGLDKWIFPGLQGGPLVHTIAAKAVSFLEDAQPEFVNYQKNVLANARTMAEQLTAQGLTLVTGGTDKHLLLVDLTSTGVTGKQAEEALCQVNITVNKNAIPFDSRPPNTTSGIRLGTPAVTSRGLGQTEITKLAQLIARTIFNIGNSQVYDEVRAEVMEINDRFPTPGITR